MATCKCLYMRKVALDCKPKMQAKTVEYDDEFSNAFANSIPVAETYFSIPQDLENLENMNVLDYLKEHVWLSSKRQKKCKTVFQKLTNSNAYECEKEVEVVESCDGSEYNMNSATEVPLPMGFLGVALVDLFEFPATHHNMTELYNYLEHDKLKFRELDFRTWCGVSAFAERMVYDGPLQCENLEKADFKYLKSYGDWFDISTALRNVFTVIEKTHENVMFCKLGKTFSI